MKKYLLISYAFLPFLAGCSGPTLKEGARNIEVRSFEEKAVAKPKSQEATGNLYFLERRLSPETVAGELGKAIDEFETALRNKAEAAGYRRASDGSKAHLRLYISAEKTAFEKNSFTYATQELTNGSGHKIEIKGGPVLQVAATGYAMAHAKRPVLVTFGTMRASEGSFANVSQRRQSIARLVRDLTIPAATEPRDARSPGCYPTLGFDTNSRAEPGANVADLVNDVFDDEAPKAPPTRFKITKILPKGAAAKAGLRAGDDIEAIDSIPYAELHDQPNSLYENMEPVPVKFYRNGKLLRATIRAEISCP